MQLRINRWQWGVLIVLLVIAVGSSIISVMIDTSRDVADGWIWWEDWLRGFSTELLGAMLTFIFFGIILGNREKQEAERQKQYEKEFERQQHAREYKRQLVREMGSQNNMFALEAVRELREADCVRDGTLHGASFKKASLNGVDLRFGELERVNFWGADLSDADLRFSDMEGANLAAADLTGANLEGANLRNVDLGLHVPANQDSWSRKTSISATHFDERTVLPDGTKWISNTDMDKFTNPAHKEFWRSKNIHSPASKPTSING